ncbi:hypothetical protein M0R04_00555 [Candidatus Dojkabacteria bacterium]|jgi:hypothetical protein|nr:hypothetical protein [Candidatus Dojkabacteria bacterium]
MPTIDLSNQKITNSNPSVVTPTVSPSIDPQKQAARPFSDGWDNPWADTPVGQQAKRQSPQERLSMIEKIYADVLGRKPDTRDINYYKYSTLSEEEIREQLLSGNEHKQLIGDGREYKKVKDRALQAETRVKLLEGQIRDQVEEFRQLTNLLNEKNSHIKQLREKVNLVFNTNPFNSEPQNQPQVVTPIVSEVKNKSVTDKLRHVLQKFV